MAKPLKRLKAREIRRKEGKSINDIAKELNVSKGSVSVWCRDINLTKKQKAQLRKNTIEAGHAGRIKGARVNREKKQKRVNFWKKEGLDEFSPLSKRELLLAGASLYWAEGSKTRPRFSFSNSDPEMIKFIKLWLLEALEIDPNDLVLRVQINEIHKPRIKKVLNFWSELLELPLEQFKKPFYVKTPNKKVYDNHEDYYGIMVLRVRKSSELVYKILGQIHALKQNKLG